MKCDRFMERYLGLDNGENLPLPMRVHLLRCVSCRAEAAALRAVMNDMESFSISAMDRDVSDAVMSAVLGSHGAYGKRMALYKWIGTGATIFASIFVLTLSDSLALLKTHYGGNLEVPLSIVMGVVITIYATVFIGTHMDEFNRWLGNRK